MHPHAAERLTDLGLPSTLFTRNLYRIAFTTTYIPLYVFVKTVAFCTRKDTLEVLSETANKLKLDIEIPIKQ